MGGFEAVGSIALGGLHEEQRNCDKHGEFTARQWTSSIWSGCPQCVEDTKAARRLEDERLAWERRKMDEQARVEGNLNRAMIPARFRGRTFENFVADTDEKRHVLDRGWFSRVVLGRGKVTLRARSCRRLSTAVERACMPRSETWF